MSNHSYAISAQANAIVNNVLAGMTTQLIDIHGNRFEIMDTVTVKLAADKAPMQYKAEAIDHILSRLDMLVMATDGTFGKGKSLWYYWEAITKTLSKGEYVSFAGDLTVESIGRVCQNKTIKGPIQTLAFLEFAANMSYSAPTVRKMLTRFKEYKRADFEADLTETEAIEEFLPLQHNEMLKTDKAAKEKKAKKAKEEKAVLDAAQAAIEEADKVDETEAGKEEAATIEELKAALKDSEDARTLASNRVKNLETANEKWKADFEALNSKYEDLKGSVVAKKVKGLQALNESSGKHVALLRAENTRLKDSLSDSEETIKGLKRLVNQDSSIAA